MKKESNSKGAITIKENLEPGLCEEFHGSNFESELNLLEMMPCMDAMNYWWENDAIVLEHDPFDDDGVILLMDLWNFDDLPAKFKTEEIVAVL